MVSGENKIYYKSMDHNLCGYNGFQYTIGETADARTEDVWYWLHFSERLTDALSFMQDGGRLCEVQPIGRINRMTSRRGSSNLNARKLKVIRELVRNEIFDQLLKEECPIQKMVHLRPTFQELMQMKQYITRSDQFSLCYEFDHLSEAERKQLFPEDWCRECILNIGDRTYS